ncbi:MAG: LytS/YhcK type 5TM receptor domain-containing protein [Paludibacter sp.]|nr:LytS/YhcK type 5TM receptor domain-containing protein [Paludibacter sp.]
MKDSFIVALLQNTAILLTFAMLYENFWLKDDRKRNIATQILTGMIIGAIGILLMFTPWLLVPGIVFDTRSVMLSIAGLFFGGIPTIVAIIITATLRFVIGGEGQWMGVAVIAFSGSIGLLWRKYRPNWRKKYFLELLSLGIVVHIVMSLCTVFLPHERILPTLKAIAIPLILIYSPATMLLGMIMLRQYINAQNKFAQLRLIESERRLAQILESGNIASMALNKDGTIRYCNDFLLKITGYSFSEIKGKNWFKTFIVDEERTAMFQLFSEIIFNKRINSNFDNYILSKNGKKIYFSWYNTVLFSSNEVTGVACIGVDITKKKSYEAQLKEKNEAYKLMNEKLIEAKEKAEESDRLKTVFLQNISHEIRTPMNGILGFLDLLNDENILEEDRKNYIDIINKSGKRLLTTINDVIEISRIESGQVRITHSEVNVDEMMAYLYNFFMHQASDKHLKLILAGTTSSNDLILKTDKPVLEGILINLLKNAIKFTTEGFVEFGYYHENNSLIFYVKDSGCGIPADRQKAVFERFVQSDLSITRAYEGSGLGLAIAKSYIEMLEGKIWVESEINKGSTFFFSLPFHKQI